MKVFFFSVFVEYSLTPCELLTSQAKRTKKVGIVGKYGTRYGASLRKMVKKIEISQHAKYTCSFCGKVRAVSWTRAETVSIINVFTNVLQLQLRLHLYSLQLSVHGFKFFHENAYDKKWPLNWSWLWWWTMVTNLFFLFYYYWNLNCFFADQDEEESCWHLALWVLHEDCCWWCLDIQVWCVLYWDTDGRNKCGVSVVCLPVVEKLRPKRNGLVNVWRTLRCQLHPCHVGSIHLLYVVVRCLLCCL